jgi:hypothetical protein
MSEILCELPVDALNDGEPSPENEAGTSPVVASQNESAEPSSVLQSSEITVSGRGFSEPVSRSDVDSDDDVIPLPKRRKSGVIMSSDGSETESCDEDPELIAATGDEAALQRLFDESNDRVGSSGIQERRHSDSESVMSSDDEDTLKTKNVIKAADDSSGDESAVVGSSSQVVCYSV